MLAYDLQSAPMHKHWQTLLTKPSGTLTTNAPMPRALADILLKEDKKLNRKLIFKEVNFPPLKKPLCSIKGFSILAGLQKITRKNHLTVFRAIRFPTFIRMHEMASKEGYSISNFEQNRILSLYQDPKYKQQRKALQKSNLFYTQPQERVVNGLPVFALVNDAIQIHNSFRGKYDKVLIIVIHIPQCLIKSKQIKLISNPAIDLDHLNTERDHEIESYTSLNGVYTFDFNTLANWGIDLHEMYSSNLPNSISEAKKLKIKQEFYLLNIRQISNYQQLRSTLSSSKLMERSKFFLHGFWGDQNVFGRAKSRYLPYRSRRILVKK